MRLSDRCRAVLNRPLFGTRVIPPGARVDPERFPEPEFPVHCTTCNYRLQGLPSCRCPECGHPFDRGRLLVEQYVMDTESSAWRRNHLGRTLKWISLGALALVAVTQLLIVCTPWLLQRLSGPAGGASSSIWDQVQRVTRLAGLVQIMVLAVLVLGLTVGWRRYQRFAARRERVWAAIEARQAVPPEDAPGEQAPATARYGEAPARRS